MAHSACLTIIGEKSLISAGCNTEDSIGRKAQEDYINKITVLATHLTLAKDREQPSNHFNGLSILSR